MRRLTRLGIITAVIACTPPAQQAYIAPNTQSIISVTEQATGANRGHLIFVENHSTVPITVFGTALQSCQNVRQRCESDKANVHIGPGGRSIVLRVEPSNPSFGMTYHFSYSWRPDSVPGRAAVSALAGAGNETAQTQLTRRQRADSIHRADPGMQYPELGRTELGANASRVAALRTDPDSITLAPGEEYNMEFVHVLVLDSAGNVLGRTHMIRFGTDPGSAAQFVPPDRIVGRRRGRAVLRFSLSPAVTPLFTNPPAQIEFPINVAYRPGTQPPVFAGRVLDADTKAPLACARVVLEDSARNEVAGGRAGPDGGFDLDAPFAGTYRVRVDLKGWSSAFGPTAVAGAGERKTDDVPVRFAERLVASRPTPYDLTRRPAQPTGIAAEAPAQSSAARGRGARAPADPMVSQVALSGSSSMPILQIVGRAPAGSTWAQFAVDTSGRVNTSSVLLPPGLDDVTRASVLSVLPRLRYTSAAEQGKPVCELVRLEVNLNGR